MRIPTYTLIGEALGLRPPSASPIPEIPYIPNFLTKEEADALFEVCKRQPSQRLKNPRGTSNIRRLQMPCYSATPAFRGSRNEKTNPWMRPLDEAPTELKQLADKLTLLAGKPINYLSLVGYENEKDHIVWHQHREDDCRDARVFILSLGETRTFGVREVCPEGKLCAKCNDDACRDGENSCTLCEAARKHRKTCPKCKDRKNWILIQPAHGSLITLPHEYNKTHEHAILDDKGPRGLRISINTKHLTQADIDYFHRLEQNAESVKAPKVYDCHAGKSYPKDAVYAGREVRNRGNGKIIWVASPLGNHKRLTGDAFREYALEKMKDPEFRAYLETLRGKDLLCWCDPSEPWCHARVWLELINAS